MNKTELINAIAAESGLTKADSKKALDGLTAAVTNELGKGGKIALVGFGTYSVTEKSARTGINPRTKQPIKIAAKKVVKFKPGADLAKAVAKK
ncbi:MAG: HU family DNA-binding protein [Dysgonamonadaceae bacterium]|nr:HU family DNA-binding protein [Dysgonamonadaceae bacterium]